MNRTIAHAHEGNCTLVDTDRLYRSRRQCLYPLVDHPRLALGAVPELASHEDALQDVAALHQALEARGCALAKLAYWPSADDLIALATCFGIPMAESEEVAVHVEAKVILNVRNVFDQSPGFSDEPFSNDPVRAHSECSVRPYEDRPRYLMFHYASWKGEVGGQTIVTPMDGVVDRLDSDTRGILSSISMTGRAAFQDVVLRQTTLGSACLALREPRAGSTWRSWRTLHPGQVDDAWAALLDAVYSAQWLAVPSEPGLVAIIDNERFLHARTAMRFGRAERWLRRIRIAHRG